MKCNQICKWNSNAGCVKPYGVPCILENVSPTDKKATNADRIRNMSDEELAQMLAVGRGTFNCFECPENGDEECSTKCDERCLEWLQQPAEEG